MSGIKVTLADGREVTLRRVVKLPPGSGVCPSLEEVQRTHPEEAMLHPDNLRKAGMVEVSPNFWADPKTLKRLAGGTVWAEKGDNIWSRANTDADATGVP